MFLQVFLIHGTTKKRTSPQSAKPLKAKWQDEKRHLHAAKKRYRKATESLPAIAADFVIAPVAVEVAVNRTHGAENRYAFCGFKGN